MPSSLEVLQIIADGKTYSGEALSNTLGISRAAIWKHIQKLEAQGIDIQKEKGRGYRLAAPLELLNVEEISAQLGTEQRALLAELHLQDVVDSTNALALQGIGREASGTVWIAEQQTAGRGRRGRHWVSPFGTNLYFSVLWNIDGGAAQLGGLSLALGVTLVEALAKLDIHGLALKWPNDIVFEGKKLGGMLIEIQGDAAGDCHIVVGIGINVAMPAEPAAQINQQWTDLAHTRGSLPSRNKLAAALIGSTLELLSRYSATGFAPFAERWNALDSLNDREVVVMLGAGTINGIAKGAGDDGALLLSTSEGIREFHGGEVSLRAQQ